jgi:hypothetical protein
MLADLRYGEAQLAVCCGVRRHPLLACGTSAVHFGNASFHRVNPYTREQSDMSVLVCGALGRLHPTLPAFAQKLKAVPRRPVPKLFPR